MVLSLGTGQHTTGYDAKEVARWGAKDWLTNRGEVPLVDMVFNASAEMVDYNLSIIFQSQECSSNYLRIQVPIYDDLHYLACLKNMRSYTKLQNLEEAAKMLGKISRRVSGNDP